MNPTPEALAERVNHLTTVKTIYARVAILLLAVNFCLTGYILYSMNAIMQEQLDNVQSSQANNPVAQTVQALKVTE